MALYGSGVTNMTKLLHYSVLIGTSTVVTFSTSRYFYAGSAPTFNDRERRLAYKELMDMRFWQVQKKWIREQMNDKQFMADVRTEMKLREELKQQKNKLIRSGKNGELLSDIREAEQLLRHNLLAGLSVHEALNLTDSSGKNHETLKDIFEKSDYFEKTLSKLKQLNGLEKYSKYVNDWTPDYPQASEIGH